MVSCPVDLGDGADHAPTEELYALEYAEVGGKLKV